MGRIAEVLACYGELQRKNGTPPSMAEVAEHLGFLSTSTVCNYVRRLEEQGLLVRQEGARNYRVAVLEGHCGVCAQPLSGPIWAPTVEATTHIDRRALEVTAYIRKQQCLTGRSPSLREVGRHIDGSATSTAFRYAQRAVGLGLLECAPGVTRSYRAVGPAGCCGACGQALKAA
jgi:SOS-response transcriptional repressor LexA